MEVILITVLSVILGLSEVLPFIKKYKCNGVLEAIVEKLKGLERNSL
tara:strand:+ start:329 stop:469 length:141 start_codon:yes stop_codon:yes gene_type:complete